MPVEDSMLWFLLGWAQAKQTIESDEVGRVCWDRLIELLEGEMRRRGIKI